MKINDIPQKIIKFFKEVKIEAKKVSWLTWKEAFRKALIVVGVSAATAVLLGGLDAIFTWLVDKTI